MCGCENCENNQKDEEMSHESQAGDDDELC